MKLAPNQSLLDIAIQGCGSLEAAMQMAADNNMALSDMPVVGTDIVISAAALALGDAGSLKYLGQNSIVIGTKGGIDTDDVYVDEDGEDYADAGGGVYVSS